MKFSVVLPARDAAPTLPRVLGALLPQLGFADDVVVVDDGSRDGTREVATGWESRFHGRLRVLAQAPLGAAAARNAGVRHATGDLVLFLGADVVPAPQLLQRHRTVHRQLPEATVGCLGFVTWDPALPPTPFMIWLEHGGPQNSYGRIAGQTWVDPRRYCYAANLSFKRAIIEQVGGFDAMHFSSYGWEDIDFGIRVARAGGRLLYEPTARAWHVHPHSPASFLVRQERAGRTLVVLTRLHPDGMTVPRAAQGWRWRLRRLCAPLPVRFLLSRLASALAHRWILPRLYARVTGWVFTDSVHAALRAP